MADSLLHPAAADKNEDLTLTDSAEQPKKAIGQRPSEYFGCPAVLQRGGCVKTLLCRH